MNERDSSFDVIGPEARLKAKSIKFSCVWSDEDVRKKELVPTASDQLFVSGCAAITQV